MDLGEVFLFTEIEFLRSALSQPGGSIQAICVPSGAVRTQPLPASISASDCTLNVEALLR